jgi:hypothetical protein
VYGRQKLTIYVLQQDRYVESPTSPTFPGIEIADLVCRLVDRAEQVGSSQASQELEEFLQGA